jgi:RNA polymerase sigma factor (sigma-70 family)
MKERMTDPRQASELFRLHAARLVLYARQWLDRGAAEDVVQDVFIRLMAERRWPDEPLAWMYRAVRNAAVSAVRSDVRRRQREQTSAAMRGAWFDAPPDGLIDAPVAEAAVKALPDELREVVVLRIWSQLGFQQIAELVGVPVSTVHDRYRRGLTDIRKSMESRCQKQNRT